MLSFLILLINKKESFTVALFCISKTWYKSIVEAVQKLAKEHLSDIIDNDISIPVLKYWFKFNHEAARVFLVPLLVTWNKYFPFPLAIFEYILTECSSTFHVNFGYPFVFRPSRHLHIQSYQ